MSKLSVQEQIQLSHLEKTIEDGVKASLEMAQAIWEIRQSRLYRNSFETFEEYCLQRWQFSDRYARMLIGFAETANNLQLSGTLVPPTSERQTRPITSLPAQQQLEAWEAATTIAPSTPTSAHTTRAAAAVKARSQAPAIGQKVTVLDEDSPHYGQQVEVASVTGVIVEAVTEAGQTVALLTNEITPEQQCEVKPKTPKPNSFETLETTLKIAEQRIKYLEGLLRDCLPYLDGDLKQEVGEAID